MQKITESLFRDAQKYAEHIICALNQSVTQYHAVNYCRTTLEQNGFKELREM